MTQPMRTGLTIGKFAPLHNGHVDLIRFALTVVDTLFIIVYDAPDKTKVPLNVRSKWIRELFPSENVIVIEGYNAPNRHEDTTEVRAIQESYIGRVMSPIKLTHFVSSEKYGKHLSDYLKVANVIYDMGRSKRNISSTMIRNNYIKFINELPDNTLVDLQADFNDILVYNQPK